MLLVNILSVKNVMIMNNEISADQLDILDVSNSQSYVGKFEFT